MITDTLILTTTPLMSGRIIGVGLTTTAAGDGVAAIGAAVAAGTVAVDFMEASVADSTAAAIAKASRQ